RQVYHGNNAVPPEAPEVEGHTFVEWQDSRSITADTEISAVYEKMTYTVIFYVDGIEEHRAAAEYDTLVEEYRPQRALYLFSAFAEQGQSAFDFYTPIKKDTDLYCFSVADYYTVTYMVGDEVYCEQKVAKGGLTSPPAQPQQQDYEFSEWRLGEQGFDFNSAIDSDLVLNAAFDKLFFEVYFDVSYASFTGDLHQTVPRGQDATPPTGIDRAGYTFVDWDISWQNITADTLITAIYSQDDYTVNYYLYDSKVFSVANLKYGDQISVLYNPDANLHLGDEFVCWLSGAEQFPDGEQMTVYSNLDLYAVTRKITLYLDVFFDGEKTQSIEYEYGATLIRPEEPACDPGYAFDDWYKESEYLQPFAFSGEIRQNLSVYGRQLPICFDVHFVITIDGDSSYTADVTYGDTAPVPTIEIPGYELSWYADEQKTAEYDFTCQVTQQITIFCKAEEKSFAISIDVSAFEGLEAGPVFVKYKQNIVLPVLDYYGYTHTGYALPEGGAVPYAQMPAMDFHVVPLFSAKSFCLSFDLAESVSGEYLSSVNLPLIVSPEGYYFDGWLDSGGLFFESVYEIIGDMYFTAKLTKIRTVTVVCLGQSREYYYGDDVSLEEPQSEGYVFLGWYTDEACEHAFNNKATISQGDTLNVFPKWIKSSFTLRYSSWAGEGQLPIDYGVVACPPEEPEFEGHEFCGWYCDSSFQNVYQSRALENDCEIYGKFEKKVYSVTFMARDRVIAIRQVPYMESAVAPEERECVEEGYSFDGFIEEYCAITGDLTVRAKYTKLYKIVYKDETGRALTAAEAPDKEGYNFVGWRAETGEDTIEYYPVYVLLSSSPAESEEPGANDPPVEPGEEQPSEEPLEEQPEEEEHNVDESNQPASEPESTSGGGSYLAVQLLHLKELSALDVAFLALILFSLCFSFFAILRSLRNKTL
ncbi:MAG: InlB B-repeat-containing protein, partial [Clostridia bacterium]|nr:InlB B-repeat-containing protein [Clostridia bacterium]